MESKKYSGKAITVDECFCLLWEYLTIRDQPLRSDAIFVFGRDDFSIAEKALRLYQEDAAPTLVLLGGRGRLSGQLTVLLPPGLMTLGPILMMLV